MCGGRSAGNALGHGGVHFCRCHGVPWGAWDLYPAWREAPPGGVQPGGPGQRVMLLGMLCAHHAERERCGSEWAARDNPHEPAEDDPLDLVRCPEMGMLRLTDVHAGFKWGACAIGLHLFFALDVLV